MSAAKRRAAVLKWLAEWLTPLLIMLPAAWALLPGGLPNTADGAVHFMRAAEMVHAWQDGIWLPRWSQHLGYGYGIPLFVYTPPLPYLLVAGLHRLGLPPEAAYKGMLLVGMAVATSGAYRMGRALLGVWAGAVSAAAFLYAPIQLRELFIQGNAAQFLAWAFPPWAVWAVIQLYRTGRIRYAVGLALALVGTTLSHNVAALLAMGLTAGLALALLLATRAWRCLLWTLAGSAFGLALSGWFWAPALLEAKQAALDRIIASDFRTRFVPLAELVAWPPRLDTGAINPAFPLTLGAAQVGAALLGVAGWLALVIWPSADSPTARTERRVLWGTGLFMAIFAAFCGFMATRWSEPVWQALPFLDLFEWPFRWHGFTAIGLSWLAGAAAAGAGRLNRRLEAGVGSALLLLLMAAALVHLYPQKLLPGTRRIAPAEVVRFEVKSAAIGSTSLGEYTPIWVEEDVNGSPLVDEVMAGRPANRLPDPLPPGVTGAPLATTAHSQRYRLSVAAPLTLTLELFYFPGWQAAIQNEAGSTPVAIAPHPGSGLMDVALPPGDYTLALIFGGTPLRRVAGWVSALAWAGLIMLAGVWVVRKWKEMEPTLTPVGVPGHVLPGIALVTALVLILQVGFPAWFTLRSPPDQALPARVALRADFEGKLRLLGIDPPPTLVEPGQPLTLAAYWRALRSLDEDYAVFLHLDDPVTGETLATADQRHPSDIPTSDWATGLYVRNPLRLIVPAGAPPIQYALRLGVYDPTSGALLAANGDPSGLFEVGRVWIAAKPAPRPPDGPQVRFGEGIALAGARMDASAGTLALYWRAASPPAGDYSIFVHLLDGSGQTIGQLDGAPYANRYPLRAWRPDTLIEDRRTLAAAGVTPSQVQRIAIGVYDLATGVRLPAVDANGSPLPDQALILSWPRTEEPRAKEQ